jgi:hypothetical protein
MQTVRPQRRRHNIDLNPDDKPFPSGLFHGTWENMALHVVIACDIVAQKICYHSLLAG